MTRYDRRVRLFAACLSALAGFVDALGFIQLGGFFVSFMSGNSTRMSVAIATRSEQAAIPALLIVLFVIGVMAGSFAGHYAGRHRRVAVLCLITTLLTAAAAFGAFGEIRCAIACMAAAMGAENAIFERDGEVAIGLTYMTGTLVKFAQRLAMALRGGDPFGWAPYLTLWVGLVGGATCGAVIFPTLGLGGLWLAAAAAGLLAIVAARLGPERSA